jgi:hypothetical protein
MGLIEINTNAWRWLTVEKSETYGGILYSINMTNDFTDIIDWVIAYKKQLELEDLARKRYESVASAYNQYQTTLKLVTNE